MSYAPDGSGNFTNPVFANHQRRLAKKLPEEQIRAILQDAGMFGRDAGDDPL